MHRHRRRARRRAQIQIIITLKPAFWVLVQGLRQQRFHGRRNYKNTDGVMFEMFILLITKARRAADSIGCFVWILCQ